MMPRRAMWSDRLQKRIADEREAAQRGESQERARPSPLWDDSCLVMLGPSAKTVQHIADSLGPRMGGGAQAISERGRVDVCVNQFERGTHVLAATSSFTAGLGRLQTSASPEGTKLPDRSSQAGMSRKKKKNEYDSPGEELIIEANQACISFKNSAKTHA